MRSILVIALAVIVIFSDSLAAADGCSYRQSSPKASATTNRFITRGNWLAAENLRIGLSAPLRFMPGLAMRSSGKHVSLSRSATPIDVDRQMAIDPYDGEEKSLRFLLDTRLYADGIVVLKGDEVVLEHYRAGFTADSARLLLQAARPFLTALLASAADRGKFSRDKSVVRVLHDLTGEPNLRKTSMQRLLDGRTGLIWAADDRRQWLSASGWEPGPTRSSTGVRSWLKTRKNWPRDASLPVSDVGGPEGELLVWAIESVWKQPVSRVLCDSILSVVGTEDEAYWVTDAAGTELADGLALSLRDFARFGVALVDARIRGGSGAVAPRWFAESLASPVTHSDPPPEALKDLGEDTAWRYRFVSLGRTRQSAIVGPFGNSLFIDFDRKVVVAIYASYPRDYAALMLQSLRSVWSAVAEAEGSQRSNR